MTGLVPYENFNTVAIVSKDGLEPPTDSYKETVLPIKLFRLA